MNPALLAAPDAPSLPPIWARIKRVLDQMEGQFVRGALRLQDARVKALLPLVREVVQNRVVPIHISLEGNFQDMVEAFAGQVLVEGMVHAEGDIRIAERRAANAGVNLKVDGQAVVPTAALDFIKSRRELSRFFDDDQVEKVRTILGNSLREGATVKQTMDALQTALPGASRARLENIARTESTAAYNQGRIVRFLQSKGFVQAVQFMAILDSRTTEICQHRDGLVFSMNDPRIRENVPPLHFQCRSILSPVSGYELEKLGGQARLEKDARAMDVAPGPQVTKTGRFGNEPWPDVQGGGAAPVRVGPRAKAPAQGGGAAPAPEPLPKPAGPRAGISPKALSPEQEEKAARNAYREQIKIMQAEVERLKDAGDVMVSGESEMIRVGNVVREEVERRKSIGATALEAKLSKANAEFDDAEKLWNKLLAERHQIKADLRDGSHPSSEHYLRLLDRWNKAEEGLDDTSASRFLYDQADADLEDFLRKINGGRTEAMDLLTDRMKTLRDAVDATEKAASSLHGDTVMEVLSEARSFGGSVKMAPGTHREAAALVRDASRMYPSDWIDHSNSTPPPLTPRLTADRPSYNPKNGRMYVPNRTNPDYPGHMDKVQVTAHELGHRMESSVPDLHIMADQFLKRRSAGKAIGLLAEKYPEREYDPDEEFFEDTFPDDYMAKRYGVLGLTEIVSVLAESVFPGAHPRVNMWVKDGEAMNFILGALVTW